MAHSLNITYEESKTQMIQDLSISRFQNLGRKYFHFDDVKEQNFLLYLTNSAKFYSFHLDNDIEELFIKLEEGHFFWAINSPINIFFRDYYKKHYKEMPNNQSNIQDIYTKWTKSKSIVESKHNSSVVINTIKKCEEDNLFSLIINSMILIYEPELFDPVKSNELLEKAFEQTDLAAFEYYSTELKYLIRLYQGYIQFIDNNFLEANQKFQDAIIYKSGISALFYKTLTDFILYEGENVNQGLNSIIEYDYKRITFALETNNLFVFNYLVKNNIVSNFFKYELVTGLGDEFEAFFNEQKLGSDQKLKKLQTEFDNFKNLRMDDLDLQIFEPSLNFVEKLIQSEQTYKNVLYHCSINLIKQKFKDILKSIYNFVVSNNYKGIEEKLSYFDKESEKIKIKLDKFNQDAKKIADNLKIESKNNIAELERKIDHNIALLDNKLNNLSLHSSYNPLNAFKNSISYSFIISLLIFIVAGMASYTNVSAAGDPSINQSSVLAFITPGIKWGSITFLLGFLFALFSSVSAITERSAQKQKIVQRIGYVKNEKERQIEIINKNRELDIRNVNENLAELKIQYQAQLEKIAKDKSAKEIELKKEADEIIAIQSLPIQPFLS
jgi:hypothetical protein